MILIRSVLFVLAFYLWTAVLAIPTLLPAMLGPRRWTMAIFRVWTHGIFVLLRVICDIRVELRGREHMPRGRAVVAPKHQCMFDVFAQFAWLDDSCFVMRKELMRIPVFGLFAWKTGMVVLDREGHSAALKKLVRDAKDRFADGRQVVIFPEGTRTAPGAPSDYKPGIAALYREIDVPVHPVATNSGVHWSARGQTIHRGTIVFEFLEPIPPGLKRAEFMRLLRERNETASAKLLAEGL